MRYSIAKWLKLREDVERRMKRETSPAMRVFHQAMIDIANKEICSQVTHKLELEHDGQATQERVGSSARNANAHGTE